MSAAEYECLFTEPEVRAHIVKFVGGSAAITKVFGKGMTLTRMGAGIVKVSWTDTAENPGNFIGVLGFAFQATTPGNVKNYEMVHEAYVASTRSILINLYESGTLTDLDALEWLTVTFLFKEGNS